MNYLVFIFSLSVFAQNHPGDGLYKCIQGNNDSVCDQLVRVYKDKIKVIYDGYCGGQGPFTYYCNEKACTDGGIKISFKDETHYLWENRQHQIYCDMEKI